MVVSLKINLIHSRDRSKFLSVGNLQSVRRATTPFSDEASSEPLRGMRIAASRVAVGREKGGETPDRQGDLHCAESAAIHLPPRKHMKPSPSLSGRGSPALGLPRPPIRSSVRVSRRRRP